MPLMVRSTHHFLLAVTMLFLISGADLALGQTTRTWNGATADLNTAANWTPSGLVADGDPIRFDGGGANDSPTFDSSFQGSTGIGMGNITVTSGQTDPLNITNTGAANLIFRLANGAGIAIESGAGATSFGGGGNAFLLVLGSGTGIHSADFLNNSVNTALFNSNVTLVSGGTTTQTAAFAGTGNWTIAGPVTNNIAITKSGTGTLELNGTNNYSGLTTITGGTLKAGSSSALGSTAAGTIIEANGTLDINGQNLQGEAITVAGTITNTGATQSNALRNVTLSGNATLTGTSRWDIRGGGGTLNLAGFTAEKTGINTVAIVDSAISAGNITITAGTLSLTRSTWTSGLLTVNSTGIALFENNSTGTYSMNVALSGGTMRTIGSNTVLSGPIALTGTNTVAVATGIVQTLSGPVSGAGAITKTEAGTLVLSGTNSHSGGTIIGPGTNGILRVTNTAGLGTGAVTVNGGILELLNNGAGNNGTITHTNNVIINSGNNSTIHVGNNGANTGNTIVIGNTSFNLGNSTLNVTGANDYQLRINALLTGGGSAGTAVLNPTTANIIVGNYTNGSVARTLQLGGTSTGNIIQGNMANGGGTGVVTIHKTDNSTWSLNGNNTFSGGTSITAGTLLANNTGSTSATGTGAITLASGAILGGSGRVAPTGTNGISIQGTISPGTPGVLDGIGTFTLAPATGNATFAATGAVIFQLKSNGTNGLDITLDSLGNIATLGGTYNGTGADRLIFDATGTGLLDLTGASDGSFNVVFASGYTPMLGDAFDLLDWDNALGIDTRLLNLQSLTGYDPTWVWDDSRFVSDGVIAITTVVPEPGRAMLLIAGLAALITRRRRQVAPLQFHSAA